MPELPEVETIARGLKKQFYRNTMAAFKCHYAGVLEQKPDVYRRFLLGKRIGEIKRHGKYIFLLLEPQGMLAVHLRMTGQLCLVPVNQAIDKHTHLEFFFKDFDQKLIYRDIRKFGRVELLNDCNYENFIRKKKLGSDALEITPEQIGGHFRDTKRNLKAVLLDQSVIAGLGNIYTDEILFREHLSPLKRTDTITPEEITSLLITVKTVLRSAISKKGTTISDYVDSYGNKGSFQYNLAVYGQKDKLCPECGHFIIRERIAGRSTYYCTSCQRS